MGADGITTINFGAFPGATDAFVDVATVGVVVTSRVEGWMHGNAATAEHSVDEHFVENTTVFGRYLSNGNIRIHALTNDKTRRYGNWNVGWVWNG